MNKEQIETENREILKVQAFEERIVKESVKNVKKFIANRKKATRYWFESQEQSEKIMQAEGLNIYKIDKYLFEPLIKRSSVVKKYNAFELLTVLEYYRELLIDINDITPYPAQIEQYCKLLGISLQTFKTTYLFSQQEDLRDAAQQVVDFVSASLSYGGMTRQIDNTAQIFVQKSSLNKRDQDQTVITNNNNTIITTDDFAKQVALLSKN